MCAPIKCLINTTVLHFHLVLLSIAILFLAKSAIGTANTVISNNNNNNNINIGELFAEQEKVEHLVREWAPLVWLAPGEKFMPGDVTEFLHHVHAEKAKIKPNPDEEVLTDEIMERYYYDTDNELSTILSQIPNRWERRHKRTFKDKNYLLDYIIDLPVGEHSSHWHLVTNDEIDDLLDDTSSFIYGQSPMVGKVPIYAMVTMCGATNFRNQPANDIDSHLNSVNPKADQRRSTYIPVSNAMLIKNYTTTDRNMDRTSVDIQTNSSLNKTVYRNKRSSARSAHQTIQHVPSELSPTGTANITDDEPKSLNTNPTLNIATNYIIEKKFEPKSDAKKSTENYPHFHVTYWMFYPYSQGKTMCTLSLGPFGQLPIPQIFGVCLGTRKDFGSHVGDWEHMTLFFKGNKEPDELYVSAHDAGAYYAYERLTGTFDFRRQETRKGILQHPNFPKTVVTSVNHPVLFSAEGSHGLWTAPGKHRFVRVARLFDVNGFGTPWATWKEVEISYENEKTGRSIGPEWLRFNGRWGNPKSKCHPLKKVGLNFCEYSDGPTGIPVKTPHFYCPK